MKNIKDILSLVPDVDHRVIVGRAKDIIRVNFAKEYSKYVSDKGADLDDKAKQQIPQFVSYAILALILALSKVKSTEVKKEIGECVKVMDNLFYDWRNFASLRQIRDSVGGGGGNALSQRMAGEVYRRLHALTLQAIEEVIKSPRMMANPNRGNIEQLKMGTILGDPRQVAQLLGAPSSIANFMGANEMIRRISKTGQKSADTIARELMSECTGGGNGLMSQQDLLDQKNPETPEQDPYSIINPQAIIMISTVLNVLYNNFVGSYSSQLF